MLGLQFQYPQLLTQQKLQAQDAEFKQKLQHKDAEFQSEQQRKNAELAANVDREDALSGISPDMVKQAQEFITNSGVQMSPRELAVLSKALGAPFDKVIQAISRMQMGGQGAGPVPGGGGSTTATGARVVSPPINILLTLFGVSFCPVFLFIYLFYKLPIIFKYFFFFR